MNELKTYLESLTPILMAERKRRGDEVNRLIERAAREGWAITPESLRSRLTPDQNEAVNAMIRPPYYPEIDKHGPSLIWSYYEDFQMRRQLTDSEVMQYLLLVDALQDQAERNTGDGDSLRLHPY